MCTAPRLRTLLLLTRLGGADDGRAGGHRELVAMEPTPPVAPDTNPVSPSLVAALVVENLELVARFTAKPTGQSEVVTVATTKPVRGFAIELTPEAVPFHAGALDTLRRVFPGPY